MPVARPILIAGSAHLDVLATANETPAAHDRRVFDVHGEVNFSLGGTACNLATSLHRAGIAVRLWSAMNRSACANLVRTRLVELGLDLRIHFDCALPDAGFVAFVEDRDLTRAITATPVEQVTLGESEAAELAHGAALVVLDGNLSVETATHLARAAQRRNIEVVWHATSDTKVHKALELRGLVTLMAMNRREAQALMESLPSVTDYEQLAQFLNAHLIITRDASGALYVSAIETIHVAPGQLPPRLVHRLGLGDALLAATFSERVRGSAWPVALQDAMQHLARFIKRPALSHGDALL
jgi:sugar/nucleoside kinase (ribokinase family)